MNMAISSSSRLPAIVTAFAVTCGCAPANLGQDPDIIWWTDHESGNISVWKQGGDSWAFNGGAVDIVSSPNPTRSGKYSLRSSVKSQAVGTQSGAQVSRNSGLPTEGYYSAWYFFPSAITSTNYWAFVQFRSRTNATDASTALNWWDFEVMTESATNGGLPFLSLYEHSDPSIRQNYNLQSFPVGRWFQVEIYLKAATDSTGHLVLWFDGQQIFEVSNQATVPSNYLEWVVGGATESINPDPGILFIDDAAISRRRLGPDYPVFWQAQ